jgi:hypothetical protein
MSSAGGSGRRGLMWAILGGVVMLAGVVAIIVGSMLSRPEPAPTPSGPTVATPDGLASPSATAGGEVVDPSAEARGWRAEPVTADSDVYIAAALEAAATFDTQLSSREEWLDYLDTWFTPDTRYTSEEDQQASVDESQIEMRTGVVLPEEEWDSLAREDGRVVATTNGDIAYVAVTDDPSGDMSIGTADVTLTFTRGDGSGGEASYEEQVLVSVQVLCGPDSVPTPDSPQRAGDCKVVRYFTEPLVP